MICVANRAAAALSLALVGTSVSAQAKPDRISDHLRISRATLELGTESDDGPELFGGIGSAAIDGSGALYVLDVSDNSVRMFDSRGRFLTRVGRLGRGPGDLATPHQIFHDGDSSLYVIDAVNGVSIFRSSASTLRFTRSFGAELRPRSACLSDATLVVAGYRNERMLHFVDERGSITRSIGGPFPIKPPPGVNYPVDTIERLKEYANTGAPVMAVCADGVIAVAQLQGPGLRAYRPNGDLLWSAELPGYHGHTYWQDPQGRPVTVYGNDATRTLIQLDSQTLLVQVSRRQTLPGRTNGGRMTRAQQVSMTSTLIDLHTGRLLATGTDLPHVLAVRGTSLAEGRIDPFPQIRVRSFSQKTR